MIYQSSKKSFHSPCFSVKYFAQRALFTSWDCSQRQRFNSMMLKYIIMFWHNCISNGLSEKGMHKCQLQHGTNKALLCAREQSALWQYTHIMLCYFYSLYLNLCQQLYFFLNFFLMEGSRHDVI